MAWKDLFKKKESYNRTAIQPHSFTGFSSEIQQPITKREAKNLYENGLLGDLIQTITLPIRQLQNFEITDVENSEILEYLQSTRGFSFSETLENLAKDLHLYGVCGLFFPAKNKKINTELAYSCFSGYCITKETKGSKYQYVYTDSLGHRYIFEKDYGLLYYNANLEGFLLVIEQYPYSIPAARIVNELRYLKSLGIKNIRQMEGVSIDYMINLPENCNDPMQLKQFKETFFEKQRGPNGERVVFSHGEGGIHPISQTNREAEYLQTAQEFIKRCYNWAQIPLALRTTDASSYNNLHTAKYALILDAVLPVVRLLLLRMHGFMLHFFPSETGEMRCVESDISTMSDKETDEIIKLYQSGLYTLDEARTKLGLEAINEPELPGIS